MLKLLDDGFSTEKISENYDFTNISATDEYLYFGQNSRKSIYALPLSDTMMQQIFVYTPNYSIQAFKIYGDKLLLLEGNSAVTILILLQIR